MKYMDEYRDKLQVKTLSEEIRKIVTRQWHIMEICGGQTHALARYRIEELLPAEIKMLHGPGCPVCVTPVEIIDRAMAIAARNDVIMTSFGDMMRVPGSTTDLFRVKAAGADVRMLYSPLDAIELAVANPDKEVVFFAIGFETTAPVHLMALREALRLKLTNFSLLTSLFTVPPAIQALLADPESEIDAFLTAGHVCAITGDAAYQQLAAKFYVPVAVTGFEPVDLVYGIYRAILQLESGRGEVENAYKRAVPDHGNPAAQTLMSEMLEPCDQEWRGIGIIPRSGLKLKSAFDAYNAQLKFSVSELPAPDQTGCIAGEIMRGLRQPADCPLFGRSCSPDHPKGAPMVSSEGVCAAYYRYK